MLLFHLSKNKKKTKNKLDVAQQDRVCSNSNDPPFCIFHCLNCSLCHTLLIVEVPWGVLSGWSSSTCWRVVAAAAALLLSCCHFTEIKCWWSSFLLVTTFQLLDVLYLLTRVSPSWVNFFKILHTVGTAGVHMKGSRLIARAGKSFSDKYCAAEKERSFVVLRINKQWTVHRDVCLCFSGISTDPEHLRVWMEPISETGMESANFPPFTEMYWQQGGSDQGQPVSLCLRVSDLEVSHAILRGLSVPEVGDARLAVGTVIRGGTGVPLCGCLFTCDV